METQLPGHRGDEACDAGRAAGWRVIGAADAVVLDGLNALLAAGRGDGREMVMGKMAFCQIFPLKLCQMRVFWAVVERPLPILASKLFEVSPAV